MPKIGQNCMKKWPFFAIFLPWMASYGPKKSFLLIISARDDLVKVSWKSDAGKCPNQVTPPLLWPAEWKAPAPFNSRSRYTFSFFFWITCGWYLLQTEGAKRGYYKWNQSDFNPDSASQPTNIVLLIFIIITIGRNNQTKTLKLYFNTKYVFNLTRALVRKAHAYPDNHELVVATKTLPISW